MGRFFSLELGTDIMSMELYFRPVITFEPPDFLALVTGRHDSYRRWYENYKAQVGKALSSRGQQAVQQLMEHLPTWISDERNLWAAWRQLSQTGSAAPGPNGSTWSDFAPSEVWELLRLIRDVLRSGEYRRGRERRVKIPKSSGAGSRVIYLADIQDRVVARAVQQVLRPWLEATPPPNACSRFARGSLYAIARASILMPRTRRFMWGIQDLRDAFDHVPRNRLLDVVRTHVPSEPVIDLLRELIAGRGKRGIPQGSPLSPLLFETYRTHLIDRPWRDAWERVPLVTYVDDLLVLGHPTERPDRLHAQLDQLATAAGFATKFSCGEMFRDIRKCPVTWLGYEVSWRSNRLVLRPELLCFAGDDDRAEKVNKLADKFVQLHQHGDACAQVRPLIRGVLDYAGAGYHDVDCYLSYEMICAAARRAAFTELPSFRWFEARWRSSYEGWRRIRRRAARATPPRADIYYAPSEALVDGSAPF